MKILNIKKFISNIDESKNVLVVKPDTNVNETEFNSSNTAKKIFLAGTIDNGDSTDWQKEMTEWFSTLDRKYIIYNPRRDNWNTNADTDEITKQINWELEKQENADAIVMVILGNSKSPITLLELGLFSHTGKLYVICEKEFYRHTNVKVTCERYKIPLFDTIKEFKEKVEYNEISL